MSIHFKTGVKEVMAIQWKSVPGQQGVQDGKSNHTGRGQAFTNLIGQSNSHSQIQRQWDMKAYASDGKGKGEYSLKIYYKVAL